MRNHLLNSAKRTLKNSAAASFGLCLAVSSFAQEPVHAIHHPVEVLTSTERGNGDTRPQPEIEVNVLINPSPSGIFTVHTIEEDVLIEVYNDRMTPIRVELENVRPGQYVIDMSKNDNGIYTMVVTAASGQSLRQLVKGKVLTDGVSSADNKLMELQISVYPNATTEIFTVQTNEEKVSVKVFDKGMRLINAPINHQLNGLHTIDLTNQLTGVYFVQVSTKFAMATEQIVKREVLSDSAVSNEKLIKLQVSVYPNASHDIFTVQTEEENAVVQVFDRTMKPINAPIDNQLNGTYVIDLKNHQSGDYFVQVSTKSAMTTERIVKRDALSDGAVSTEKQTELQVSVYPNPTNGIFTVQTEEENAVVQLFDRTMKPINAPVNQQLNERYTIDLTNFQSGVYFVQVRTKSAMATERIMKR